MIFLHVGKLGRGKTYWAVRAIFNDINHGRNVYVNFPVDYDEYFAWYWKRSVMGFFRKCWSKFYNAPLKFGKIYYWSKLEDIYPMEHGIIYFDEAQRLINAKKWESMPQEFLDKITQSRKCFLDLHIIAQHSAMVLVDMRRIANFMMRHNRFFGLFYNKTWDGDHIEKMLSGTLLVEPKSEGFPSFYFLDRRLAKCYNTYYKFNDFGEFKSDPIFTADRAFAKFEEKRLLKKLNKQKVGVRLKIKQL
jgi:hypothetical protein